MGLEIFSKEQKIRLLEKEGYNVEILKVKVFPFQQKYPNDFKFREFEFVYDTNNKPKIMDEYWEDIAEQIFKKFSIDHVFEVVFYKTIYRFLLEDKNNIHNN